MSWLYRAIEQHRCLTPAIPATLVGFPNRMTRQLVRVEMSPGDIWQCDDSNCGQIWVLIEDRQDGGFLWERIERSKAAALMADRGVHLDDR